MPKEHCCCGCIHTGALIIGSLVLSFGIIGLLASVARSDTQSIVINALSVIIGGCILYADIFDKPGGYLPYLILTAIGIVIYTVFIIPLFSIYLLSPTILYNFIRNYGYGTLLKDREIDPKTAMLVGFLFVTAVLAFVDCIAIWLWMVIYRAYEHTKGDEEYD